MTSSSNGITQQSNLCGLMVFAVFDDVHIIEKKTISGQVSILEFRLDAI